MDNVEKVSLLNNFIANAIGNDGDTLSVDRAEAIRRYNALPYGDEQEGRSSVLTTECRDTIMWLLPSIIKTFLSTDKVVEFLPLSEQKEEQAQQQTDFINYIIMQENESFTLFHNWFLDALQLKNGYVKYGYDEIKNVIKEDYTGIDQMSLARLLDNPDYDKVDYSANEEMVEIDGQPITQITSYDVETKRTEVKGKYFIENIRPERVLVNSDATNMEDLQFIAVIYYKTKSELLQMGYSRKIVDDLPTSSSIDDTPEGLERDASNDIYNIDDTRKVIKIYECYVKIDEDGDGIDELHRIILGGDSASKILDDDIVDDIPIVPIAPFLKPHSFFGDSMVDYSKDIQRINTSLWRQILDYIYLANNPMWEVNEVNVNKIQDVVRRTPGGLVRTKASGSITPIITAPLQPEAFGLLDRLKDMKDRRTGVMEINQGLDPNAINKTATGVVETMDAGKQLQDLIVRVFAETGVKRLFKGLYKLVVKHQSIPRTLRLRNKWVTIDPSTWDINADVIVNVGLGTGSSRIKQTQLEHILVQQKELMALGLVTPQHIYNTMSKIIAVAGYKDIDSFMLNPANIPQPQPAPPKPSVEDLALREIESGVQREQIKANVNIYEANKKAETELMKVRADMITKGIRPNV